MDTDAALTDQLQLEAEGHPGIVEPGHAAVRYTNPTTGGDVLPTIRAEMHRVRRGTETAPRREAGSSVYQVFDGTGTFVLDGAEHTVAKGDLVVVPSWVAFRVAADEGLDLFRFSDHPIIERLAFQRVHVEEGE